VGSGGRSLSIELEVVEEEDGVKSNNKETVDEYSRFSSIEQDNDQALGKGEMHLQVTDFDNLDFTCNHHQTAWDKVSHERERMVWKWGEEGGDKNENYLAFLWRP
jgi:hypothetical protein